MEGDRVAALLIELASNRVVDFKEANLLDRKWQLRLKWLARSFEARKSAEVVKLGILRYSGALGYGAPELFNESWEGINTLLDNYIANTLPWQSDKTK